MGFRLTIGRKIGLGFGIILFLFITASVLTTVTLNESRTKTDKVTQIYNPSVAVLKDLENLVNRSKLLITKWYYVQTSEKHADKIALHQLLSTEYPALKVRIKKYSVGWNKEEQESIDIILSMIDVMFESYEKDVMQKLNSFEAYNDSNIKFEALIPFEDLDVKFHSIQQNLSSLIEKQNSNAIDNSNEMLYSFDLLQNIELWLGILLICGGTVIAILTVRSIIRPLQSLKKILLMMGKGILPQEQIKKRNDEIGEMSLALNELVNVMTRTTQFANQIGSGNFDSYYMPLSNEDTLGTALIKMREDLRENERVLEEKVLERTEEVVRQKEEIEMKNYELEVLFKHVTDSIKYAKRIQEAILPPESLIQRVLPNSFVLYRPKDIVSGDFYWIDEKNGKTMFGAIDCTGHGVPGAFMSIVGYNILKQVIDSNTVTSPAFILDRLNEGVSETLHHGHEESYAKDGMDVAFCTIDFSKLELEYAGAYNPLYIVRAGELIHIKGDKFPVGLFLGEEKKKFANHKLQLQSKDCVYIFSDGYADQFGGPKGKKFMSSHFRNLLLGLANHPIDMQKQILSKTLQDWCGNLDQVDDILVIGLKID
jgi:serine phosphatase RsbU (regulator of sigma subunit)/HAMP domain-containing protein